MLQYSVNVGVDYEDDLTSMLQTTWGYHTADILVSSLTFGLATRTCYHIRVAYDPVNNFNVTCPPLGAKTTVRTALEGCDIRTPMNFRSYFSDWPHGYLEKDMRKYHPDLLAQCGGFFYRLPWDMPAPSQDGLTQWIHPEQPRLLTESEYTCILGAERGICPQVILDWMEKLKGFYASGAWGNVNVETSYKNKEWVNTMAIGQAHKHFDLLNFHQWGGFGIPGGRS